MKFNPGDKVVLVKEDHWSERDQLKIGQIYTVKANDGSTIKLLEGAYGYWLHYNQLKKVVTTVDIGAKVVRGKDWDYDSQDKDAIYGIIEEAGSTGWVKVAWQSKQGITIDRNSYRIGDDDKYDLYYYDGAEIVTTEPVFVPPIVAKPELLVFDKSEPPPIITKPELLVFGSYKIGSVVVSLQNLSEFRTEGGMFEVLKESDTTVLSYKPEYSSHSSSNYKNSTSPSSWRAATEIEAAAFKRGITNINEIMPEPSLAFETVAPKSEPKRDELVKEMQKFIPGYHLGCTLEVVSLPDIKGNTRVGSRFVSNPSEEWLEHMLDEFIKRTPTCAPDPLNTFEANYLPENLKVVFEIENQFKSLPGDAKDIPHKELEGKFVRCIGTASYAHQDYYYDRYYFVSKVTNYTIRIVDQRHVYSWNNDSAGCTVRKVFDLSKGYTYDEIKDKIDEVALKKATCSGYQIPGLFVGEPNLHLPDTSITVVRPTSTKHKPDASFQVAFVETQLRKPGKKTKIKF
jgi:hypothetical protein